ncbi:tetratricopeptide repeat protein [Lentzea tibetensis]|uniref:Tetratricopeptide repeat protein n=1 Tax=Lentzea tibetensis TaxID=2591470 RepID=A0A563EGJ9_9PSEU|nr:BTAD domain-containing putative transcriptional regulator [Lentzea tibetensis]TWP45589.1 tetratricopeptide repeat protein [Lentzea tibetensis]
MRVRLLGPVTADVDLGPVKQQAVLAMLALRLNQPVPRDEIIDGVWGEAVPPTAANLVATYVARLRRLLEPGRARRTAGTVLVSTPAGYSLRLPSSSVDVSVFEDRLARCDFTGALALWRGTPLEGVPGPFAAAQRRRLTDLHLTALEQRVSAGLSRDEDWTSELTRLVAAHPYRERLRALLMTALHQRGQWAEALAVFEDAKCTLATDLGVSPGPELHRAYRRTLAAPDLARHYVAPVQDADRVLRPGRDPGRRFGSYHEAMTWLEHRRHAIVDAGVASDDPTVAASLATSLRAFMHRRGYWDDLRKLAAAAAARDDDHASAQGLLELGGVDYLRGRLVQADAQVSHSLTLFRMLGDTSGTARALNNLSMIRADRGMHASATELADAHMGLCVSLADRSVALDNLALIAVRRGRFDDAVRLCTESLDIHRSVGSSVLASFALHLLGVAHAGLGDRARGEACLRRSIRLARLGGNRYREKVASASLAQLRRADSAPLDEIHLGLAPPREAAGSAMPR